MANGVKIEGDLNISINAIEREFPRYARAALYAGADVLKKQTKANLVSMLPKATEHNPKYNDVLTDAIRNTKTLGDEVSVHILGGRQSGGGSYRTRFFEGGTKERYQKKQNGVALKKPRRLGTIKPLRFFESAISTAEASTIQAMQTIIDNFFEKYGK